MADPKGINPKLKHCPEYIKRNPTRYDECSPPIPSPPEPADLYSRFSFFTDLNLKLQIPGPSGRFGMGAGLVGRPTGRTSVGFWGYGAQLETGFQDDLVLLARVENSHHLNGNGVGRLRVAALGGFRKQKEAGGIMPQIGLETALHWRWDKNLSFSLPLVSARHTWRSHSEGESKSLWEIIFGARLSFDFLPAED